MKTDPKVPKTLVVDDDGQVRRLHTDAVGNRLDATLRWCAIHIEPAWQYDDGSFGCPHECVVQVNEEHEIVDPPWLGMRG